MAYGMVSEDGENPMQMCQANQEFGGMAVRLSCIN
jgi:hypothetical protein